VHCRERVEIGNYALISWGVLIADFDAHSTDYNERIAEIEYAKTVLWPNFSRKKEPAPRAYAPKFYTRPIIIEDGAWIGANATILKGAKIGRGSIIGANAVVTGEIPPMSVAVGNPARVVRTVQ
jgi:galactoside O-acetyltransferase